jgi:annexin A7/11
LIKAVAYCSPEERAQVAAKYQAVHGKSLKAVMKSECGKGDFGTALQFLSVPSDETECDIIKAACKGAGTDELLLYPVICGRNNTEINLLKKKFFNVRENYVYSVQQVELSFRCGHGPNECFLIFCGV